MKKIKFMAIVAVSLFISSYSYAKPVCLLGVTPNGTPCGQITQTSTVPVKPNVSGGSSNTKECDFMELEWEHIKRNIYALKSKAKGKLKNLRKDFEKDKKNFKANYKRKQGKWARQNHKTKDWIVADYRNEWNNLINEYAMKTEAIIELASPEIKDWRERKRKIKERYSNLNCKSKK